MAFVCPIEQCPRRYRRKGELKTHMLQKHTAAQVAAYPDIIASRSSAEGKPYVCPYPACADTHGYQRPHGLRRHLRQMHAEQLGPVQKEVEEEALFVLISLSQ